MRILCGIFLDLILLYFPRLDIVARSAEVRGGGQGVFSLHAAQVSLVGEER
jgi:hypothetical protein